MNQGGFQETNSSDIIKQTAGKKKSKIKKMLKKIENDSIKNIYLKSLMIFIVLILFFSIMNLNYSNSIPISKKARPKENNLLVLGGGVQINPEGFTQIENKKFSGKSPNNHGDIVTCFSVLFNSTYNYMLFAMVSCLNSCNGANLVNGGHGASDTAFQSIWNLSTYHCCSKTVIVGHKKEKEYIYNKITKTYTIECVCVPIYKTENSLSTSPVSDQIIFSYPIISQCYYLGSDSSTVNLGVSAGKCGLSVSGGYSDTVTSASYYYCIDSVHKSSVPSDHSSWKMNTGKTGLTDFTTFTLLGVQISNLDQCQHSIRLTNILNTTYFQGTTLYGAPLIHLSTFTLSNLVVIPKLN